MKKLLCTILVLLLCAAALPSAAAYSNNLFEYAVQIDRTVMITGYHGSSANVNIPSELSTEYGMLPVAAIGKSAFQNCTYVKSVVFPDTVTAIGTDAFRGCTKLTSITVPDSVTDVGCWAFEDTNLQNLPEDDDFVYIGKVAYRCKRDFNYADIRFQDGTVGIAGGIFYVSRYAGPRSVYIPDSVKVIGDWAFRGCGVLERVRMSSCAEKLGNQAFMSCDALKSLTLPRGIKTICYDTFEGDCSLTLRSASEEVHQYANCYDIPFVRLTDEYPLGDADGNDDVDICDASVVLRRAAGIPTARCVAESADADENGEITVFDATCIQRFLAEVPAVAGVGVSMVDAESRESGQTYTTVDFGRFTADVPDNWVYEKRNDRFAFFEAYNHTHEETGSDGYLCEIFTVELDPYELITIPGRFLGKNGAYETYIQYPTGMGIISDKTGNEKMQEALRQENAFEASVTVK